MKRALSVLLSLLIAMSMFVGIDFTAYANDTAVAVTANDTEFPYDDADVYVADCIINGMIDKEGNINNNVISLDIALNKQYTYELIAEELVDDELLMFNSLYWQNIKKTLSADFVSMANWEEELCILLIIDYLNYYGQTEEFESNYIKNSIKFTESIYEGVFDYAAKEYDIALADIKDNINQIIANQSVESAKELTEKWGFTKDLKKYTALGDDLQTVATTATQYYQNLTKALSVQRADEARIDFLKQLKIAGNSNTTFVNAVDKVIAMYESSYATLALGEGTRTMLNHGMSVLFSEAKKACPEAAAIIDSLKTYNEGLNWLFNSDDISENNLKLVLIYTIGNYAKSSVRSARDAFTANPTVENAQTFISTYEGYLKYQEYASESTKGFVSSALFDGVFNQIKGWFTDKNVETYKDFIELLDSNINICYSLERLDQQYYDLYYEIVDYDCSAFADDDSSGSENIPVTSVSFKQPEITLNSTDDICLIYADIYPSNATNKKVTYICSDESILSVPINGGFATQKGTGVVTVTATTEDGGYTATQTVYVGDYTTSEVTDSGTCGDNLQWILYNNGTLVISGTGDMINYDYFSDVPWYKYRTLIKAVKIGNNVTSIGDYAFEGCENITSIIIPENVTSIGFSAFVRCSSLKSIDIPASVTSFGNCIFWWCSNLEEITIGQNLLSVGQDPFYRCLNLKRIIVDQNNPKYESIDGSLYEKDSYATGNKINLVYYSRKDNTTFQVPKNVIRIYRFAFDGCENLETITLPEGLERIESDAFSGCCNLDKIVLPNSVTNIGNSVFRDCSNLSEVILSENIKEVSQNAFDGCISLQSVLLPSSVQTIEWAAFSECTNLKKIYLPSSLTKIVSYAFNNCTQLEEVYFSGSQKEWGNIQISTDGNEYLEKADINYNFYYYPKRIQINKTSLNLIVGQNETLEATITPSNFNNIDILWESDNAGVATVENGEVVAVNIGIATISAKTSNGLIATCSVVVKPRPIEVTKIALNKTNLSLNAGNSETLTATVYPENATNKTVTWTSSDNSVAKVENGKVTGISTGTAKITAKTSNNITATCFVTVSSTSNMEEIVGDINFDGVVSIIDATEVQMHLAKYIKLSDIQKNVADTNGDSIISILDATEIQMYLAKYIDHFKQPSSINLNTNSITLVVGNTQTLSASILPNDATNKTISWFSSNNSIATVSNGVVTAKAPGTAIITAKTYNGKTSECTITVKEKTIDVTGIKLNSNVISLNTGNTYQLIATVTPENATNKNITWYTNDSSIATVSSNGKITAVSIGKTTITAKASNGATATCTVSVVPIQVSSISLSDTSKVLYLGFTHYLTATVKPDNANDKSLTWSSSNPSVVTVSSNGMVTAKGIGTATVTAKTSNGISASCVYTVKSMIEPESVEISVERLTLTEGNSYDLSYSVLPSNADNKTIEWSSSNDSWVNVNQSGRITAVKSGVMATITAETANGKKDTVIVDVVRKASEYGKYLNLGLKTNTGILPPAITPNNPSYSTIRGDDLYFISDIDSELYQGAKLNMYVTSGSSGTYATYNFTLGAENAKYDYKTNKGYISISKHLNWHRGQYIRVYSEIILANGQVVKPANLDTDDAIYLYMHPSY